MLISLCKHDYQITVLKGDYPNSIMQALTSFTCQMVAMCARGQITAQTSKQGAIQQAHSF